MLHCNRIDIDFKYRKLIYFKKIINTFGSNQYAIYFFALQKGSLSEGSYKNQTHLISTLLYVYGSSQGNNLYRP